MLPVVVTASGRSATNHTSKGEGSSFRFSSLVGRRIKPRADHRNSQHFDVFKKDDPDTFPLQLSPPFLETNELATCARFSIPDPQVPSGPGSGVVKPFGTRVRPRRSTHLISSEYTETVSGQISEKNRLTRVIALNRAVC